MTQTIRKTRKISFEDFVLADSLGGWQHREVLGKLTILHYEDTILMCSPVGACLGISSNEDPLEEPLAGVGLAKAA